MTPPGAATVRCPTCRATQDWSDTCRRCRSDLRLLRLCARDYHQSYRACLDHLAAGRLAAARVAARRCHALAPGAATRRLLAVVALGLGDWSAARALGRAVPPL